MKALNLIAHPVTVIICYLLILISGEAWGGFYMIYLLFALPHVSIFAVSGSLGVILLLVSNSYGKRKSKFLSITLNLTGGGLMIFSLMYFFLSDKEHYNYSTFHQTLPLLFLSIASITLLSFMLNNVIRVFNPAYKGILASNYTITRLNELQLNCLNLYATDLSTFDCRIKNKVQQLNVNLYNTASINMREINLQQFYPIVKDSATVVFYPGVFERFMHQYSGYSNASVPNP